MENQDVIKMWEFIILQLPMALKYRDAQELKQKMLEFNEGQGYVPDYSFANSIIDNIDIVEFIGRSIPLKLIGINYFGVCPFCGDDKFSVNPARRTFHCFNCQEGGNVITFVMKHGNFSFRDATERLESVIKENETKGGTKQCEKVM